MLVAVCSAKGSPGATTAALALGLSWPDRVVLAECDPSGGDVLAGFGRGQARSGSQGLTDLMAAARNDAAELELWTHLVTLDPERRAFLLPGVTDPRQSRVIDWARLVTVLASTRADVIADCGRLRAAHQPSAVLYSADLVLLACRATLRSVHAARSAAAELSAELAGRGSGPDALGLLLIGAGEPFPAGEVERAVGVPVVATLPVDVESATVLSDGAPPGRSFSRSALMRAAGVAAKELVAVAAARRDRLGGTGSSEPRAATRRASQPPPVPPPSLASVTPLRHAAGTPVAKSRPLAPLVSPREVGR